ncbi:thioesterase [Pseudomonas tohonis]|uniref:Thioesterase n=1 Tax=Pseudomonas tohonis TaxID=2725477 RepID=A0A6J4E6K8_9PSED|nr:thioesterase domain-containing protein [Pseudomonas tohonis]BCG24564.1 thioesterase [Pseudomonas tohonis]GJN52077.1 thioesterase [Pseudomonas tohonis]
MTPALQLFCVACPGVGAVDYPAWGALLPAWVQVRPVPLVEVPGLSAAVAGQLARRVEMDVRRLPYAVIGHGFGALAACELLYALRERGAPGSLGLFASGSVAPSRWAEYQRGIASWRPAACVSQAAYRHRPRTPLACPVHVLAGVDDGPRKAQLKAWSEETTGRLQLRLFEGDHRFIRDRQADVLAYLVRQLDGLAGRWPGAEAV